MQYNIKIKREHFPEKLDVKTLYDAFWHSSASHPTLMDKAIREVLSDFHDKYFLCPQGEVYHRSILDPHEKNREPIGKIDGYFRFANVLDVAEKFKKDVAYEQDFILFIN
jgi:hypothetical protein